MSRLLSRGHAQTFAMGPVHPVTRQMFTLGEVPSFKRCFYFYFLHTITPPIIAPTAEPEASQPPTKSTLRYLNIKYYKVRTLTNRNTEAEPNFYLTSKETISAFRYIILHYSILYLNPIPSTSHILRRNDRQKRGDSTCFV